MGPRPKPLDHLITSFREILNQIVSAQEAMLLYCYWNVVLIYYSDIIHLAYGMQE